MKIKSVKAREILDSRGNPTVEAGSLSRSERIAKYNRLLKIEEELKGHSIYGLSF